MTTSRAARPQLPPESAPVSEAAGTGRTSDRRFDLDWIRIGVFGLLILYHVGMFYSPWDWHLKTRHPQAWLAPLMASTNPWRIPLLFLISGAATRFIADKMKPGELARQRSIRLFPPLIFGMMVVVPPQTWLQIAQASGSHPAPYLSFWLAYLTASGGWTWHGAALSTPTWNHLWYVLYLLTYTLALAALLQIAPATLGRAQSVGERAMAGCGAILVPIAVFLVIRFAVAPYFPETHAFFGDWTVHCEGIFAFGTGYLFAKSDTLWNSFVKYRFATLLMAVLAYGLYAAAIICWPGEAVPPAVWRLAVRTAVAIDQWMSIATILGFARVHLAHVDGVVRRYLTEAIFPFYIVHQTIIIAFAYALAPLRLNMAIEATILLVGTFAGCSVAFEIVRRVAFLRPLFGLKAKPANLRRAGPAKPVAFNRVKDPSRRQDGFQ